MNRCSGKLIIKSVKKIFFKSSAFILTSYQDLKRLCVNDITWLFAKKTRFTVLQTKVLKLLYSQTCIIRTFKLTFIYRLKLYILKANITDQLS